jgi:hypothetical protein
MMPTAVISSEPGTRLFRPIVLTSLGWEQATADSALYGFPSHSSTQLWSG